MMKKKGFTLAEVLITLTIIGVVAVLTLPTLMTNTAEQQAKTALKKMANTMTNSANMAAANLGFDYSAVTEFGTAGDVADETKTSVLNILKNTAKISSDNVASDGPTAAKTFGVAFADGTAIYFEDWDDTATQSASDGHINGFRCVFDTNGTKGPNLISNCQSKTSMDTVDFTADATTDSCTKQAKVIRDRFMMRLRNDIVAPIGAASAYILNDDTTSNDLDLKGDLNYS